jgi:hypothetical protein
VFKLASNIYELICNTLKPLGYPVKEQGTYPSGTNLPETYITYFLVDRPNKSSYDNKPASETIRIQLALYSRRPSVKQNADELFKSVMLPGGFLRIGGRDLPFSESTGHYAYTCDYRYYEMEG